MSLLIGPGGTVLGTFPHRLRPYNNVQPFSYQDGYTYLEKLEDLSGWLQNSLIPHINTESQAIIDEFTIAQDALRDALGKYDSENAVDRAEFIETVTAAQELISRTETAAKTAANSAAASAAAAQTWAASTEALQDSAVGNVIGTGGTKASNALIKATRNASVANLDAVYIETRDTGLITKSPANLRTGLAATKNAGGGYTTELTISVVGTKGSNVLTSSETLKVAGLGANKFAAVINSSDKLNDIFVTVVSNDGSTKINLRKPLEADITGTLSAKYDEPLGQHLTKAATRALVQHALATNDVSPGRGPIVAGNWDAQPPAYNREWAANASLAAYGLVNSPAPIVRTGVTIQGVRNAAHPTDIIEMYPNTIASGVLVGTHKKGHGAAATLYTGRVNSTVEFYTSAARSTDTVAGYRLSVIVTGDGVELYNKQLDAYMNRVIVPVSGFDKVEISVTNDNDADTPYSIALSNLLMRRVGVKSKVGFGNIAVLGDSWTEFYDGYLGKVLAEKTGAKVTTFGKGGTTTDWALAWFNTFMSSGKFDECWIHFYINDSNQTQQTYVDPAGNTYPLWPSGLTLDQAAERWVKNIRTLIYLCQRNGIRPVVFIPSGTASDAQTARTLGWAHLLNRPPLADYVATAGELADPAAYVNTVGKKTGAVVMVDGMVKRASGPLPNSAWS